VTIQPGLPEVDPTKSTADQTEDLSEVTRLSRVVPRKPLGVTGLNRNVGYVSEEFLPALRGQKAVQIYREMLANSPLIGASVSTIEMLIKNVSWEVVAPDDSDESKAAEEIVRESMEGMDTPWRDVVAEGLSFIWYGWAFLETTYEKRNGYVGWRDMSIRAQETLVRWVFDDYGRAVGMVQSAAPRWEFRTIPLQRGVHILNRSRKRNPEGVSALRNAYEPWYYSKRMMQIEAIGLERDLAGLPIMWLPADLLRDSEKNANKKRQVEQFTKLVRSVRRDANEGLILPLEYDTETKQKRYDFQLLSSGGGRQFDTSRIIERYEQRMLQAMMTDFIMLGAMSATGSYAMHLDKTGMLRTALNGHAQQIAEALNRQAVPRLMMVNAVPRKFWPKIVPSDVDAPNLGELAQFMGAMAQMGMQFFPDADVEAFVRKSARMPAMSDEERKIRTSEKKKADITRFIQAQQALLEAKAGIREASANEDTSMQISSDPESEQEMKDMALQTRIAQENQAQGLTPQGQEPEEAQAEQAAQQQEQQAGQAEQQAAAQQEQAAAQQDAGMAQEEMKQQASLQSQTLQHDQAMEMERLKQRGQGKQKK
jgi:hypothetical protein